MSEATAVGAVGLTAALILPLFAIRILRRVGVIDEPNHRSSHTIPAVRGVGVACIGAMLIGGGVGVVGGALDWLTMVLIALAASTAVLGLVEDLRGLRIGVRLSGQLVIGVLAGAALVLQSGEAPWFIMVVAVWVIVYVNMANFMDGVDSISGLHGIVAGSFYAILGVFDRQPGLLMIGLLTAVVFAGFLPWNVVGVRRVFLGDVGSYLLGALVAFSAAAAWFGGSGVVAAVAPAIIYVADTAWTLWQRTLRREPLTQAHRTHVYQRLTNVGWSHVASGLTVALVSAISGAAALVAKAALIPHYVAVLIISTVTLVYLSLPRAMSAGRFSKIAPRLQRHTDS